jgi:hypothetical protein
LFGLVRISAAAEVGPLIDCNQDRLGAFASAMMSESRTEAIRNPTGMLFKMYRARSFRHNSGRGHEREHLFLSGAVALGSFERGHR